MIDLNFINPDEQSELRKERYLLVVRDILGFSFFTVALTASIFLVGKNLMQQSIAEITESSATLSIQQFEISQTIGEINKEITAISRLLENRSFSVAALLASVSSQIPDGNRLTSLEINALKKTILLKGYSSTRSDLLSLRESLERIPEIERVEMPISNLLSKTDIEFNLTLFLSP